MLQAYLALVLHAHERFSVEEHHLQMIAVKYSNLLHTLEEVTSRHPSFRMTLAFSPTLLSMLHHPLLRDSEYLSRLKTLHQNSAIQLIATGASNALLPLMRTEESIRAQLSIGIAEYAQHFDRQPSGIWLPKCAFTTGVDRLLREQKIRYFFVHSQSVLFASPRPNQMLGAPLMTPYGVSAFAQYNPIDFFKHYLTHQQYCNPHIQKEIDILTIQADRRPVLTNFLDSEELDHHWESFLSYLRFAAEQNEQPDNTLHLSHADEYLTEYPMSDTGMLAAGCLSKSGYLEDWLNAENGWIYRHLHEAEQQLIDHANCFSLHKLTKTEMRALNQAVREFMFVQNHQFALDISDEQTTNGAVSLFKKHLLQSKKLLSMVGNSNIDSIYLKQLESRLPILPKVDFKAFASHDMNQVLSHPLLQKSVLGRHGRRILMLAWEFPPLVVGGLARAVYDLSKHLVAQGHEVHVVTTEVPGSPPYEFMEGIHVHRMHVYRTSNLIEFLDWVFQMNTSFTDFVLRMRSLGKTFDVIHAHDWLVYYAARELKYSLDVPLVATIHATEHGRNHGQINSAIQNRIAELEWNLTFDAAHVIACSHAMEHEVKHIFQLPPDKVSMIHNGVDLPQLKDEQLNWSLRERYAYPGEKIIFYVGRLVYEKGVHVLIEAMPRILQSYPNCKLIIAGAGGMKDDLQRRAAYLGHKVLFVGFVDDNTRNFLLKVADVCVFPSLYEPFGIVALEAMNTGAPVVVSDVGGLAEIVDHGKDGYKALPGHVESLSWHICDLLHHPQKAKIMAEQAKHKTVNLYNWKQIAKRTSEVYEIAIKRMRTGR